MSVREHFNPISWLTELRQRYDISKTLLNDSPEGFTVMFHPNPHRVLLVARYDRTRGYGVVICRRERDISVEYDKRQHK